MWRAGTLVPRLTDEKIQILFPSAVTQRIANSPPQWRVERRKAIRTGAVFTQILEKARQRNSRRVPDRLCSEAGIRLFRAGLGPCEIRTCIVQVDSGQLHANNASNAGLAPGSWVFHAVPDANAVPATIVEHS